MHVHTNRKKSHYLNHSIFNWICITVIFVNLSSAQIVNTKPFLILNQSNTGFYIYENEVSVFLFTTDSAGEYRIEIISVENELDTVIYLSEEKNPYQFIAFDDDYGDGSLSKIHTRLHGNTEYALFVSEFNNKSGRITIDLFQENESQFPTPTPLTITSPSPTPIPTQIEVSGNPIMKIEPSELNFHLNSTIPELSINQVAGKTIRQNISPVLHLKNAISDSLNNNSIKTFSANQYNSNARLHYLAQFHMYLLCTNRTHIKFLKNNKIKITTCVT